MEFRIADTTRLITCILDLSTIVVLGSGGQYRRKSARGRFVAQQRDCLHHIHHPKHQES